MNASSTPSPKEIPPPKDIPLREVERARSWWAEAMAPVRNVHIKDVPLMFNYRRIALWLIVLLVPGGVLLLPLLIAEMRQRRVPKQNEQQNHDIPSDQPMPGVAA
jgi:hypothetical protein